MFIALVIAAWVMWKMAQLALCGWDAHLTKLERKSRVVRPAPSPRRVSTGGVV